MRVPGATYRLQLNRRFGFAQAREIAQYLRDLGISDCYASPVFKAGPQSTHGYDVCGFDQVSSHLGNREEFKQWCTHLRQVGLGLLVDMVPNHMGADLANAWWFDVLEKGPESAYAGWLDINWQPLEPNLQGRVLLPVLEDCYAKILEAGKLKLVFEDGGFAVAYYDRRFPLCASSYVDILSCLDSVEKIPQLARNLKALLKSISLALCRHPHADVQLGKIKRQLALWAGQSEPFRQSLASRLQRLNGTAGQPASFDALDGILRRQHYRLAFWRVGSEQINYRRFFDVTELVSVRMELPEVFQATHAMLFALLKQGWVTGLRIDHPDGLWNPKEYLDRLQTAPGAPLYIVAEKILNGDELLPPDWPVAGTTGYDFLSRLNGVFVARANALAFDALYREFTGCDSDLASLIYQSKSNILQKSLISELDALADCLKRIASATRYGQDFTLSQLKSAVQGLVAGFPVYRTYITEHTRDISPVEAEYVKRAVAIAKKRSPDLEEAVFDFIGSLLLLELPRDLTGSTNPGDAPIRDPEKPRDPDCAGLPSLTAQSKCRQFVMKFQQLTGPVMAKGLEDTAFYNFNRLLSLNEVGGDPDAFGYDVDSFHQHNLIKAQRWPHSLLATATHDTKRGEDARARINVLSEMPFEWRAAVTRWNRMNAPQKPSVRGQPAPDANDEYMLYQTLVGAWTADAQTAAGMKSFRDRVRAYMLKAIREAKRHTAWAEPDRAYEEATTQFVDAVLSDVEPNLFLDDFRPFQESIAFFGQFNSLSQVLLKMTSPGVPDFYQGTELWDFNLVDPDNRRPVDYSLRRALLNELKERARQDAGDLAFLHHLLDEWQTGEIKLFLIWRTLQFRRQHRELFDHGSYVPLRAAGAQRAHLCAYARVWKDETAIIVAPRLPVTLAAGTLRAPLGPEIWSDTFLQLLDFDSGTRYRNVLTGEEVFTSPDGTEMRLGQVLGAFPVALLAT